jgi:hypothetical protein
MRASGFRFPLQHRLEGIMTFPTDRAARLSVVAGLAVSGLGLITACEQVSSWDPDPYENLKDETVGLGSIDPIGFPAANLGAGGDRTKPGLGSFSETPAFVGGQPVGYFSYAMNTAATRDQLRLQENGGPYADVPTPTAYVFDASDAAPVPDKNDCTAPANYDPANPKTRHDDAVRRDQQGNVFTALPVATYNPGVMSATKYIPVVAAAPLSSAGRPCQLIKSEKAITDRMAKPERNGRYLAWLTIDPAAAVFPKEDPEGEDDPSGLGLQRWGWYKRYLIAYLDGGYIPTIESDIMEGPAGMQVSKKVTRMVTQKLYLPRTPVITGTAMGAAKLGAGYDVLAAKRGDATYSPVCEVVTYDGHMALPAEMLPKDAATIEAMNGPIMPATGSIPHYVFCLQVK